jgi:hypothetical protein
LSQRLNQIWLKKLRQLPKKQRLLRKKLPPKRLPQKRNQFVVTPA